MDIYSGPFSHASRMRQMLFACDVLVRCYLALLSDGGAMAAVARCLFLRRIAVRQVLKQCMIDNQGEDE